jgi:hypothetical protein
MTPAGATCWPRTKQQQTPACQRCAEKDPMRLIEGDGLLVFLLACRVARCATLSAGRDGAGAGGRKRWRRSLGQASWSMPNSHTSMISVRWEKM